MKTKTLQEQLPGPGLRVDERVSLEEQIAQRAHELWEHRDREHGNDLSDWLRAEREVSEWHQQRLRVRTVRDQERSSS